MKLYGGNMKFNRVKFIDETCGNLDAAFDCIDEIINVLKDYIEDDNMADGHGCYGKNAKSQVLSMFKDTTIDEYIDR